MMCGLQKGSQSSLVRLFVDLDSEKKNILLIWVIQFGRIYRCL